MEQEVDEFEEQREEEEPCGGGEAVDQAEVVHVVAVLGVNLQGCQEPELNWRGFPDFTVKIRTVLIGLCDLAFHVRPLT